MFEKLAGDILVHWAGLSQFEGDPEHAGTIETHPRGAICLVQREAVGQRVVSVKNTNVVQPQKASSEEIVAVAVQSVHPPGEVKQKLLKSSFQELDILIVVSSQGHSIDLQDRPRMNGRIHIVERELIGWNFSARMHVPLAKHQQELRFCERRIDLGHGHHLERGVPCGEPGVLPLVGHREHVATVKMWPSGVTSVSSLGGRWWLLRIAQ